MTTQASPPSGGHYVPPAPTVTPPAKLHPGRVWYLIAVAVFIAGVVCIATGLVTTSGQVNSFQRVALPGRGEVTLNHSGGYVIYYEARGAASGDIPAFKVTVAPASASAAVQSINPYTTGLSYTFGSREGRAVLTLNINSPGRFLVIAPGAPAVAGGSTLAIGSSVAGRIVVTVVASALLMIAGFSSLVTVAIIRHIRAKRAHPPDRLVQGP